jgi:hypothetical protein
VVFGIGLQENGDDVPLLCLHLRYLERATAHWPKVEIQGRQVSRPDALQKVGRQEPDGGVVQERRERLREDEADGPVVVLEDLDGAPEGAQVGRAGEVGVLHQADGEEDVVGGQGSTVGPVEPAAQVENVGQAVQRDFPLQGQVGFHFTPTVHPGEATVDQGAEVPVHVVVGGQERVNGVREPGHSLHVRPAGGGDGDGGVGEGQIGQRDDQQSGPGADEQGRPADSSHHTPLCRTDNHGVQDGDEEEEDGQDDGDDKEGFLHAAPGPVDGRFAAAEDGAQSAGAHLQQDDDRQRDAQDDLDDVQVCAHAPSVLRSGDGNSLHRRDAECAEITVEPCALGVPAVSFCSEVNVSAKCAAGLLHP